MKAWISDGTCAVQLLQHLRCAGRSPRRRPGRWRRRRVLAPLEPAAHRGLHLVAGLPDVARELGQEELGLFLRQGLLELLARLALLEGEAARRLPVGVGDAPADEQDHRRARGWSGSRACPVCSDFSMRRSSSTRSRLALQRLLELLPVGDPAQQVRHVERQLVDRDDALVARRPAPAGARAPPGRGRPRRPRGRGRSPRRRGSRRSSRRPAGSLTSAKPVRPTCWHERSRSSRESFCVARSQWCRSLLPGNFMVAVIGGRG